MKTKHYFVFTIFNLNMLSAMLDGSHYQKYKKMAAIAVSFKIKTYNEN